MDVEKDEQGKQMRAMSARRHAVLSTNGNLVLTELNGITWMEKGERSESGQVSYGKRCVVKDNKVEE